MCARTFVQTRELDMQHETKHAGTITRGPAARESPPGLSAIAMSIISDMSVQTTSACLTGIFHSWFVLNGLHFHSSTENRTSTRHTF